MGFDRAMAGREVADYADFLVPHLDPAARVLDLGCGDGSLSVGLARLAGHVVGVDAEEEFADAVAYAAEQGIDNLDFQLGDVYALGFSDGSFDACLCHSVLETPAAAGRGAGADQTSPAARWPARRRLGGVRRADPGRSWRAAYQPVL